MRASAVLGLLVLAFTLIYAQVDTYNCPVTYGWVRTTGDWTVDADDGATPGKQLWLANEPLGLLAINPSCVYVSNVINNLVPGKSYQWKVTTENSWSVNFGCPGQNGPNCGFTAPSSGSVVFTFNPNNNVLAVVNQGSSPAPSTPAPSTPAPSQAPTQAPNIPQSTTPPTGPPGGQGNGKQVFAHFIVGNTYWYTAAHWQADIKAAQAVGIDAFALNTDDDDVYWSQIQTAYSVAASVGFKLFISLDMTTDFTTVGSIVSRIASVANLPAQYKYNGRPFLSSFLGESSPLDAGSASAAWTNVKNGLASQGINIFFVPCFPIDAGSAFQQFPSLDGIFTWAAWPSPNVGGAASLTPGDQGYLNAANSNGKVYMAPISAWFNTHLSYKNYIYQCETLFFDRWQQILQFQPQLVEIITWNDWGESHYIGTIDTDTRDLPANSTNYVNSQFPHVKLQWLLPYFIQSFKNGAPPAVTQDIVVYWHRPYLKSSTAYADPYGVPQVYLQDEDNSGLTPAQALSDSVFVVTILTSAAQLQVNSGGQTNTYNVPAGANIVKAPMNTGTQQVTLVRGSTVCSDTSPVNVGTNPATYNYNIVVGGCL